MDTEISHTSKIVIFVIVYISMFLDNVLLTVVVPIIPDFLISVESQANELKNQITQNSTKDPYTEAGFKTPLQLEAELVENENGAVGMLLSSKALIQLIANPLVGYVTNIWGYNLPMFIGTMNLLIATLLFAFGESYTSLLFARSLQGVASSCISVSGLCLITRLEQSDGSRARSLGVILGSVALGVLIGYPLGSFTYDFIGKMAPFVIITFFVLFDLALQIWYLDLKTSENIIPSENTNWYDLLSDPMILLCAGAIWISTSALSVLEPCLPLWLLSHLKPHKWELGTVFIPDSIGYLVGTNCFGVIAYKLGRWRVSTVAMLLVGVSVFIIPNATEINQLLLPHFGLGLGIGVVDAALVPELANLVDTKHHANYGAVYALQQVAVSLAYSIGPLTGGELVKLIGFPWLMKSIGIFNILYCPLLIILSQVSTKHEDNKTACLLTKLGKNSSSYDTISGNKSSENVHYQRFFNNDD